MSFLVLDRLDKSFAGNHVLKNLSLEVGQGEVIALLGPSGSGKTTALRLIAGFESPDSGRIRVGGEDVTGLPPSRRHFGMVFQHYALFPHLTVGENVAFGLETGGKEKAVKLGKDEIRRRVADALDQVDLPGFADRRVGEISGGQQQRVALARALAPEPRVLLLDEPLSNLDPTLRERTRRELRRTIRRIGITTVLVTHEQEEAFHLGDRVAVLQGGVLHQVGSPEDLYERPATRFVAGFVGRASGFPGVVEGEAVRLKAGPVWPGHPESDLKPGEAAELVARPESLALVPPGSPGALAGRVTERRYAGPVSYFLVTLDSLDGKTEIEVMAPSDAAAEGDTVAVAPGTSGPRPRIFRGASPA